MNPVVALENLMAGHRRCLDSVLPAGLAGEYPEENVLQQRERGNQLYPGHNVAPSAIGLFDCEAATLRSVLLFRTSAAVGASSWWPMPETVSRSRHCTAFAWNRRESGGWPGLLKEGAHQTAGH